MALVVTTLPVCPLRGNVIFLGKVGQRCMTLFIVSTSIGYALVSVWSIFWTTEDAVSLGRKWVAKNGSLFGVNFVRNWLQQSLIHRKGYRALANATQGLVLSTAVEARCFMTLVRKLDPYHHYLKSCRDGLQQHKQTSNLLTAVCFSLFVPSELVPSKQIVRFCVSDLNEMISELSQIPETLFHLAEHLGCVPEHVDGDSIFAVIFNLRKTTCGDREVDQRMHERTTLH